MSHLESLALLIADLSSQVRALQHENAELQEAAQQHKTNNDKNISRGAGEFPP